MGQTRLGAHLSDSAEQKLQRGGAQRCGLPGSGSARKGFTAPCSAHRAGPAASVAEGLHPHGSESFGEKKVL